ncbi:hypothetical protein DPMN_182725 [Dreissena polymorpha]|uniref:Uncharacterized protein n=1 Tax=Dreissena polymorpha TaxID=45954 RepID=A0A9D4I6F1_DREPO|nr:hypothetical protein DPMN_182725 [Dreissena polymorpha]
MLKYVAGVKPGKKLPTSDRTWPLLPVHYRLYVDVRDVEKTTTMYEILAFGTNTERNCDAKICEGLFTIEAIAVL